jgi:hypothetical protein
MHTHSAPIPWSLSGVLHKPKPPSPPPSWLVGLIFAIILVMVLT